MLPELPMAPAPHPAGLVIWFTGLSGAGKTTLARHLQQQLWAQGRPAILLDGDELRAGLNRDLDFSDASRIENGRRVAEMARLIADNGCIALAATISPLRAVREQARAQIGSHRFVEIHVSTPLMVCEARDIKGLYARARAGLVEAFTGISAPYEPPVQPAARIDTSQYSLEAAVTQLMGLIAGVDDWVRASPQKPPAAITGCVG